MEQLKEKILQWADERGLLDPNNSNAQMVKLGEEIAEFVFAKNEEETKDALGDIAIVVTILCHQTNIGNLSGYKNDTSIQDIFLLMCRHIYTPIFEDAIRWLWGALQREAENKGYSLIECVEHAYNEIKDRKGKLVNGSFVKITIK